MVTLIIYFTLEFFDKNLKLLIEIHKQFCVSKGKTITFNPIGSIGVILSNIGLDYRVVKSFGVASRAIGLVVYDV